MARNSSVVEDLEREVEEKDRLIAQLQADNRKLAQNFLALKEEKEGYSEPMNESAGRPWAWLLGLTVIVIGRLLLWMWIEGRVFSRFRGTAPTFEPILAELGFSVIGFFLSMEWCACVRRQDGRGAMLKQAAFLVAGCLGAFSVFTGRVPWSDDGHGWVSMLYLNPANSAGTVSYWSGVVIASATLVMAFFKFQWAAFLNAKQRLKEWL